MKLKIKTQDIILYSIAALVLLLGFYLLYKPFHQHTDSTEDAVLNTEMPNGKEVTLDAVPNYEEPSVEVASVEEQKEEALSTESDKIDRLLSDDTSSSNDIQSSGGAYVSESDWEEIYKTQQENDELRAEKEAAEQEAADLRKVQEDQEHKMQMLERSYELASKYSPEGQKAQAEAQAAAQERMTQIEKAKSERQSSDSNLSTVTAFRQNESVVSGLTQTLSDSVLLSNSINFDFNTITDRKDDWRQLKNTIRATVDEAQTVKIGDKLLLRLKEDIVFSDGTLIPRNTSIIATTSLSGNRLKITVNSIEYGERIIGVKLQAYDLDGQVGVSVALPGEADALAQFGNALVNSGNSFSFNSNEKERVIGDLSKALIGSGATYLSKKLQTIKIHFKAGFQLYLLDITTKQ